MDVAIVSLHLSGLSSLAGSINVLTTILLMRGPALAMQRVPLFVWGVLITNLLLLVALPVLAGALTMLLTDRKQVVVPVVPLVLFCPRVRPGMARWFQPAR